jgi:hypothetical protein
LELLWVLGFGFWVLVLEVFHRGLEFESLLVFGVWCLVFGVWCLVFGVWCLVFGVWCLVFGVWDFGPVTGITDY